ncbi:MAG: hypothetical protein PHS60_00010 [Zavarzinia sp.]|nr:hypothetical protein [Zavarzinia sp.]
MSAGLAISLVRDGRRTRPMLEFTPGPDPARLLAGRDPASAAALVPLVFNLCAVAQGQAARAALGLEPAGDEAGLRLEHLRDHALCFGVAWPAALGQEPDNALLSRLVAFGAGADASVLRCHLVGGPVDVGGLTLPEFDRLLRDGATPLTRLMAAIRQRLHPDWGRAGLPRPTVAEVAARLDGASIPPRETTALDHVGEAPLLRALEAVEGRGLFTRMVARLLDCLRMLDPRARLAGAARPATGIGVAAAVRGILGHRATVADGRVTGYRLLSPTDWNLMSGGILSRVLAALPADGDLPFLARIAVSCVNPCVPTTIEIDGRRFAAHA